MYLTEYNFNMSLGLFNDICRQYVEYLHERVIIIVNYCPLTNIAFVGTT